MFGVTLLLVMSAEPAHAGEFTLTCGDSLLTGTTPINLTVTEMKAFGVPGGPVTETNSTIVVTVNPGVLGAH
jgi:hypothetical protein